MRVPLNDFSEEEISKAIAAAVSGIEFSSFSAGVSSANPDMKAKAKAHAVSFIEGLGKKLLNYGFDLYILLNLDRGFIDACPSAVFVEGRYNKFSREVAQTFHYCFICRGRGCRNCNRTGKLSENSVQEILEKEFLPAFGAVESKFHGCGREDVDVRMLGNGRPFVVELLMPKKRSADLPALMEKINSTNDGLLAVHDLKFCGGSRVEEIKNSAFSKIYSALCECESPVRAEELAPIAGKELHIIQTTPERVEKRRPMKDREKTAKILIVALAQEDNVEGRLFRIDILASHGLYVKEFISGDNGRTRPSISGLLGKKCKCRELDVLEIVMPEA